MFKLKKPNPITASTSAASYPPIRIPDPGLPIPSAATAQRIRAGCRTKGKPEREELERFWKPLLKKGLP